jgi:hypothetical protein
VADLEHVETDAAESPTRTPPPQIDASRERPWWKNRVGALALTAVLAAICVSGYFGVNAMLSHPTSPSAPGTISQVPDLPRGAVSCPRLATDIVVPFNAGARGTPTTSCAFVEQVRRKYAEQSTATSGPAQLSVVSPVTARWYQLACLSSGTYVTCTGASAAVI